MPVLRCVFSGQSNLCHHPSYGILMCDNSSGNPATETGQNSHTTAKACIVQAKYLHDLLLCISMAFVFHGFPTLVVPVTVMTELPDNSNLSATGV